VGNRTSIGRCLINDNRGNQHNCAFTQLDSFSQLVFSQAGEHVALLGVQDLIMESARAPLLTPPGPMMRASSHCLSSFRKN
jgi:mannose-1-phosphate guanylyltransferase